VVGVVCEPNLGLLFAAGLGLGATRNDRSIEAMEVPVGEDVLLGIPSSKDRLSVDVLHEWVATRGLICRNFGSTALHLAYVACGALGAVFCKRAKIWDIAAGLLLVSEAGGRTTDADGVDRAVLDLSLDPETDLPFLAAAPRTHARLLSTIRPHVGTRRP
jgi:myo-inositol-1(or 4)-monophosphatase